MRASPFLFLPNHAPVFFHQVDIALSEPGGDIDFSVGDASIDFELGERPAVHEHKEHATPALDAQRIECYFPMIIKLKKSAVTAIRSAIGKECRDVALGNAGHLFDGDVSSREFRPNGTGECASVVKISLRMEAEHTMSILGSSYLRGQKERKSDCAKHPHGDLIKGLTGFATFAV
jgi:hypothetical protein